MQDVAVSHGNAWSRNRRQTRGGDWAGKLVERGVPGDNGGVYRVITLAQHQRERGWTHRAGVIEGTTVPAVVFG